MLIAAVLSLHMIATAYNLEGPTKSGYPAGPGIVAVDPRVIPLGSRIQIEGMGEFIALDTGKLIKGNKIDIWMPTYEEAMNWGRREVTVFIYAQNSASRGGNPLGGELDRQNEEVRGGDLEYPDPDGAGSCGYNEAGVDDRPSILPSTVRPSQSENNLRTCIPPMERHEDRSLPPSQGWNPKRTRGVINPVRQTKKGWRFGIDYRKRSEYFRGTLSLYGFGHRHPQRETRAIGGGPGVGEAGSESDAEVEL